MVNGAIMVVQVQATREELPIRYQELLNMNPLLGRIEGKTKILNWTDLEIRTFQLLTTCKSNQSLQTRLRELESSLVKQ